MNKKVRYDIVEGFVDIVFQSGVEGGGRRKRGERVYMNKEVRKVKEES